MGKGHGAEPVPRVPCFPEPWGQIFGDIKAAWIDVPLSCTWAGSYLGPAAEEQIQHVLADLVVILIQKLVHLARSKTSR